MADWDGALKLDKDELRELYLFLSNNYEMMNPRMQSVARKVENTIFSTFTISEIDQFDVKERGEP